MKKLLAFTLRSILRLHWFKKYYFGLHQKFFVPYKLFKNIRCNIMHHGLRFNLQLDDWMQTTLFFTDAYESNELAALNNLINKGDTVIDIGANFGLYTLVCSKLVGSQGKVISFEPFPSNFHNLSLNVSLNECTQVQLEQYAVGKENGEISLFYNPEVQNTGVVSASFVVDAIEEKVPIISIDSYVEQNQIKQIQFIKLDIEGHELTALQGMISTIEQFQPVFLIEILDDGNDVNILAFFKQYQYRKFYIATGGELSENPLNNHGNNYLFKPADY